MWVEKISATLICPVGTTQFRLKKSSQNSFIDNDKKSLYHKPSINWLFDWQL